MKTAEDVCEAIVSLFDSKWSEAAYVTTYLIDEWIDQAGLTAVERGLSNVRGHHAALRERGPSA
jgi:hypothetical protein